MQSQGLFSGEKAAGIFFLINEVLLQPNNPKAESHSLQSTFANLSDLFAPFSLNKTLH
jgi:hypothetical protein